MLSCFVNKYVCAKIICFYIWLVWITIWGKLIILQWGALHEKPLFSGAFILGPQNVDGRPWAIWGSGYLPRSLLTHTIAPFPTQRHPGSQDASFIGEKRGMAPSLPLPWEPQTTETTWKSPWENGLFKSCRSCYART